MDNRTGFFIRMEPSEIDRAEAAARRLGLSKSTFGMLALRILTDRGLDFGQEQIKKQQRESNQAILRRSNEKT